MPTNLFSVFRTCFPADLDAPFLHDADGVVLSYRDLLAASGRFANLLCRLGLRPGDRVAVQTDKCWESLLLYLAALRAGIVYLPLNPGYTINELRYFLADATPKLIVCRPEDEAAVARLVAADATLLTLKAGTGTLLDLARDEAREFEDADIPADGLAAILYTSGTTGRSKGAMLTHANLRSNAETLKQVWRFGSGDRLLHALPIFHTHGLFVATNVTLASGASLIFLPRFDARAVIRHLPEATVLMGVPTFYSRLLAEPDFTRERAAHMRLFVSGSAPLSTDVHRAFADRVGHVILERYGMTETNMNSSNPYDGVRKPGSVGFPLPGVEIRITDPATGAPVADGAGMIEVRGPNVFAGYWQMPDKTSESFREDGFFITGDLGFIDPEGYVHIAGREKDLIISGGFNIYPAEIENALDALPTVAESAVIGVPHPDMGEAVVAVVKPADDGAEEAAILAALAADLARYKLPRRVAFVDELPRNSMGKVQKNALRETHAAMFSIEKDVAG